MSGMKEGAGYMAERGTSFPNFVFKLLFRPCFGTYPPMNPYLLYEKCPSCTERVDCMWGKSIRKNREEKKLAKKNQKPEFTPEHQRDLDGMMEKCYQGLHRPMVVKVGEFRDKIWYICQECLDAYMKDHPELKPLVVAFRR